MKPFASFVRQAGINRDRYLNNQLPTEVEELASHSPNSEATLSYLRVRIAANSAAKVKVGFRLDPHLIAQLNRVCEEKRVPRDLFMETFLNYLVNGYEEEDIPSPLALAMEYLKNPFYDAHGDRFDIYKWECFVEDSYREAITNAVKESLKVSLDNRGTSKRGEQEKRKLK
jgi:hypothetical protein